MAIHVKSCVPPSWWVRSSSNSHRKGMLLGESCAWAIHGVLYQALWLSFIYNFMRSLLQIGIKLCRNCVVYLLMQLAYQATVEKKPNFSRQWIGFLVLMQKNMIFANTNIPTLGTWHLALLLVDIGPYTLQSQSYFARLRMIGFFRNYENPNC